jgi:hypothetical protein
MSLSFFNFVRLAHLPFVFIFMYSEDVFTKSSEIGFTFDHIDQRMVYRMSHLLRMEVSNLPKLPPRGLLVASLQQWQLFLSFSQGQVDVYAFNGINPLTSVKHITQGRNSSIVPFT